MGTGANEIRFRELKDTISQLNTTVSMQNNLLNSLQEQLAKKDAREQELQQIIHNLQAQLDYFKAKLFGSSSERRRDVFPGQISLFQDAQEEEMPAVELPVEDIEVESHTRKRKKKATYDEMFAALPTHTEYVDTLTEEQKRCPECGTQLVSIGHELIRTEIRYTPAKLERIDYMATTYGCPVCNKEATEAGEGVFVKDEGTPALVPGSYASEPLVAWTMYQKFANGMPFYRQSKDMEQLGAVISRTTMAEWSIRCSQEYLRPVYDYFHRLLLKRSFLMADETTVQVLHEDGRRAQTKSYVWLMRTGEDGGHKIILYRYTATRAGSNAARFLEGIAKGTYLMVDGYQGYNKVPDVKICNCWAHVRRYLLEAIPKGKEHDYSHPAVQGVLYVDKLFRYEREYREKGLSYKQIYKRRLKDEKPILEAFWLWYDRQNPVKGDRLDRAIGYIKGRRANLETYLEDGRCSFSNNLSENCIRPFTVGRKNWLFCATVDGADANTIIYTMVEMAKAYNLNVFRYLEFLLSRRPSENMSDEELNESLRGEHLRRNSVVRDQKCSLCNIAQAMFDGNALTLRAYVNYIMPPLDLIIFMHSSDIIAFLNLQPQIASPGV